MTKIKKGLVFNTLRLGEGVTNRLSEVRFAVKILRNKETALKEMEDLIDAVNRLKEYIKNA